jgi:hypothetical protein
VNIPDVFGQIKNNLHFISENKEFRHFPIHLITIRKCVFGIHSFLKGGGQFTSDDTSHIIAVVRQTGIEIQG